MDADEHCECVCGLRMRIVTDWQCNTFLFTLRMRMQMPMRIEYELGFRMQCYLRNYHMDIDVFKTKHHHLRLQINDPFVV